MDNGNINSAGNHKIVINNRKSLSISCVKDVDSFDEKEIRLQTGQGLLEIKGRDLHMSKLTLETGEVEVDGTLDSLVYLNGGKEQGGDTSFLSKLFR